MNKRKLFIGAGVFLLILLLFCVYYLKTRYYDPKQRITEWQKKTEELLSENRIKEGDILFQVNKSRQTKAIQDATNSNWSHVGMVFKKDGKLVVYEAVQPVKITPLANWLARSVDDIFAVKRLSNADKWLTEENLVKLRTAAEKHLGKKYDIYFEWSDDNMYCSEYVWKVYNEVLGIEIGKKQKLKDFDLSGEEVKKIMKERYGNLPPLEEDVISPQDMYTSNKLQIIYP